jgi:hypothetical protein
VEARHGCRILDRPQRLGLGELFGNAETGRSHVARLGERNVLIAKPLRFSLDIPLKKSPA